MSAVGMVFKLQQNRNLIFKISQNALIWAKRIRQDVRWMFVMIWKSCLPFTFYLECLFVIWLKGYSSNLYNNKKVAICWACKRKSSRQSSTALRERWSLSVRNPAPHFKWVARHVQLFYVTVPCVVHLHMYSFNNANRYCVSNSVLYQ